jgi:hypothetical protein
MVAFEDAFIPAGGMRASAPLRLPRQIIQMVADRTLLYEEKTMAIRRPAMHTLFALANSEHDLPIIDRA